MNPKAIKVVVALHFHVSVEFLEKGKGTHWARDVAMERTAAWFNEAHTARLYNRDCATVRRAIERVNTRIARNPFAKADVEQIHEKLLATLVLT